jgi:predicted RNA binding protein YcfA (HicA-like mRNA interferase family)
VSEGRHPHCGWPEVAPGARRPSARRTARTRRGAGRASQRLLPCRVSTWPSAKARRVYAALFRIGWRLKRQSGSHRTLSRDGWPDFVFAFHDDEELGPQRPNVPGGWCPSEPWTPTRDAEGADVDCLVLFDHVEREAPRNHSGPGRLLWLSRGCPRLDLTEDLVGATAHPLPAPPLVAECLGLRDGGVATEVGVGERVAAAGGCMRKCMVTRYPCIIPG